LRTQKKVDGNAESVPLRGSARFGASGRDAAAGVEVPPEPDLFSSRRISSVLVFHHEIDGYPTGHNLSSACHFTSVPIGIQTSGSSTLCLPFLLERDRVDQRERRLCYDNDVLRRLARSI
jgi:hypothetical protein